MALVGIHGSDCGVRRVGVDVGGGGGVGRGRVVQGGAVPLHRLLAATGRGGTLEIK